MIAFSTSPGPGSPSLSAFACYPLPGDGYVLLPDGMRSGYEHDFAQRMTLL